MTWILAGLLLLVPSVIGAVVVDRRSDYWVRDRPVRTFAAELAVFLAVGVGIGLTAFGIYQM